MKRPRVVNEMSRREFDKLPYRNDWKGEFFADFIILLPLRRLHDSHYRALDFVGVNDKEMIRLSGCSDMVNINGIGGYGDNWIDKFGKCPTAIHPIAWSIDCLPKSGLFRIWANYHKIKCGPPLSSFEIFAIPKEEELARRAKYETE